MCQEAPMRIGEENVHGPGDESSDGEPSPSSDGDSSGNPSSGENDDMGHDGTGDTPSNDN